MYFWTTERNAIRSYCGSPWVSLVGAAEWQVSIPVECDTRFAELRVENMVLSLEYGTRAELGVENM